MTPADLHIGRSWHGTPLEDECPCPKAPCGLVVMGTADPTCTEHPPERAKSMRRIHAADTCPAHTTAASAAETGA